MNDEPYYSWEFLYLDENNQEKTIEAKFKDSEINQMKLEHPEVNWYKS